MTLLSIERATRRFGGLIAVNDVSFALEAGEIVGLLGPNGSGKTTLINLISGDLPASSGRIMLGGTRLTGLRPDRVAPAGVARTFQLVRILPSLTLTENVMIPAVFGAQAHWGAAAERVAQDALARVGLAERAGASAAALTCIDQKRLELARALAAEPRLLLLDEWLAGLNPTELAEGIALIRALTDSGITILMVEHVMEAVRGLCPRVVVMNSGRLVADEATEAALTDPHVIAAYLGEGKDALDRPPHRQLRPARGARRRVAQGRHGRDGGDSRRHRGRQVVASGRGRRTGAGSGGRHPLPRPRPSGVAAARAGRGRHRAGARGPWHLSRSQRGRKPRAGRPAPACPGPRGRDMGHRDGPLPAPRRAASTDRRHHVGGRTADGRDRAR
jgi:branched-chain amino acid transport system ATP-binding protein